MLKPLHFQVCEKRFQHYGLFLLLLVSLFPLFSTYTKVYGCNPAIIPDKDDCSPGQVALVPGTGRPQDQQVQVGFKEVPDYPKYFRRVFSEEFCISS